MLVLWAVFGILFLKHCDTDQAGVIFNQNGKFYAHLTFETGQNDGALPFDFSVARGGRNPETDPVAQRRRRNDRRQQ